MHSSWTYGALLCIPFTTKSVDFVVGTSWLPFVTKIFVVFIVARSSFKQLLIHTTGLIMKDDDKYISGVHGAIVSMQYAWY